MATAGRRPTTFVRSDAVQRVLAFSALLLMIVFFSVLNQNFGTFNNALRDAGIATGSERGARRDLKRRARPQ